MGTTRVTVVLRALGSNEAAYESEFVVDTGATDCVVPGSVLRRAGIQPVETMTYELADGSLHRYEVGLVRIEFMGSTTAGRVVFGAEGVEPILGVTALESVGVVVDPVRRTLRRLPAIPLRCAMASAENGRSGFSALQLPVETLAGRELGGGTSPVDRGLGAGTQLASPAAEEHRRMADRQQRDLDCAQYRSEGPEPADFGRSPWWSALKRRPLRRRPLDRHRAHEIEIEFSEEVIVVRDPASPPSEPEPFASAQTPQRRSF